VLTQAKYALSLIAAQLNRLSAGSLTNLAKAPASTVQILGAEKALFRALKTKGNTPKYGLIFHSTFIGRAKQRNKGRISRCDTLYQSA
jgi:RNA processing factor Prp31